METMKRSKASGFEEAVASFVASFVVAGFRLLLAVFKTVFNVLSRLAK